MCSGTQWISLSSTTTLVEERIILSRYSKLARRVREEEVIAADYRGCCQLEEMTEIRRVIDFETAALRRSRSDK